MQRITACLLTFLMLFSVCTAPVAAKPGRSTASPAIAAAKSPGSNQMAREKVTEKLNTRTEQKNQWEQKLLKPDSIKTAKQNRLQIKQEIREKLALNNQNQEAEGEKISFSDINQHWGAKSIKRLAALGLISGYPDGSFKPEGKITQAEALSMIMRVADIDTEEEENYGEEKNLQNVPDWAKKAARIAARHQIINTARFHSHIQATRLQTAVWLAKALGIEPADTSNIPFKDGILISKEDLGYIIALYNMGIIKGTPDGRFNPNSHITRAEIAAIIERILQKSADNEEETASTVEDNSYYTETASDEDEVANGENSETPGESAENSSEDNPNTLSEEPVGE
ncbi:S-layer homology domain-containing protein [Thermosyntropha lipolytica DSM 11003]|uniref:S-layer homology domain-containing protein n=1 Tax=Thermosyntropha lipolytica DSM 11003 TaxID=1123382 RepID=A0A1M5PUV8_9FIRM|nr:S-layer homology domain-containing protein [Thermosyntropha lipolytica]SHH05440.1 S-layer homology domain-containing protein [Thermosyntropha lipolytica DSM 11003]